MFGKKDRTMTRKELNQLQLTRLRKTLKQAAIRRPMPNIQSHRVR